MATKAIKAEEMRILDLNSAYLGVPPVRLMENAGAAVVDNIEKLFKKASNIAVICGRGNNGGDGFVAARLLQAKGATVSIYLAEQGTENSTEISRLNRNKVRNLIRPIDAFVPKDYDLIVDAMLGIGIKGKTREPYSSIIKKINQSRRQVLSVDVPSGWPGTPMIKPTATVTFHAVKEGMTKENSGKIIVADIGIPVEAETFVGPGDFMHVPRPRPESHKGDNGRVLVIGGGPFTGAPALAGMAAMYTGADLAHIAVPAPAAVPVACYSPNLIVHPLSSDVLVEEDLEILKPLFKKCDAAVIGPGLGESSTAITAVAEVIKRCPLPMVIDANALVAVKKNPKYVKVKDTILTPHKSEFQKLTGKRLAEDIKRRTEQVKEAAKDFGTTFLVKGYIDVISDGKNTRLNKTGNEALTVGGTGDVVAGVAGCLLAKGMSSFNGAELAVFINGVAGEIAFQELSYGLLATDVAAKIPYVLRRYL